MKSCMEVFGAAGLAQNSVFEQASRDLLTLSSLDVSCLVNKVYITMCVLLTSCTNLLSIPYIMILVSQGGTDIARLYVSLSGLQYAGAAYAKNIQ